MDKTNYNKNKPQKIEGQKFNSKNLINSKNLAAKKLSKNTTGCIGVGLNGLLCAALAYNFYYVEYFMFAFLTCLSKLIICQMNAYSF